MIYYKIYSYIWNVNQIQKKEIMNKFYYTTTLFTTSTSFFTLTLRG